MSKPESADDRVKVVIGKWEILHVSFPIFDRGVQPPRQLDHLRRQINADRARAAIGGFGCKNTRPARDIKQACTGAQLHGVEKSGRSQGGHRRKERVIAVGQGIVPLAFEGAQLLRLAIRQLGWRHDHPPRTQDRLAQ